MSWIRSVARVLGAGARPSTRLGEFDFAGRVGPFLLFGLAAGGMYLWSGYDQSLRLLLQLCAAYLVPFALLAMLAKVKGPDAPWLHVLPVALLGAALGGVVAALIAVAPEFRGFLAREEVFRAWRVGAGFAAFFIGLALATAAVRQRDRAEYEARQRLLEARLHMLAARIEPHFLMNTLANLRVLVKSEPAAAHAMLDHLADFLQGALERSRDLESTLGQELQIVESYLAIMQIRLGDKLRYHIDVPDDLRTRLFPALLLQTLVENAIRHGIEPAERPGTVIVRAREHAAGAELTIADDGVGLQAPGQGGHGVGLRNVRDRLETCYQGRASFRITSAQGGGTEATVVLPSEVV